MHTIFSQANRDTPLSRFGRGVAPPSEGFTLFGRTVIVMLLLTLIFAGGACIVKLA